MCRKLPPITEHFLPTHGDTSSEHADKWTKGEHRVRTSHDFLIDCMITALPENSPSTVHAFGQCELPRTGQHKGST